MISVFLTSMSLFIATNIDDLILLIMFFALYRSSQEKKEIIIGQYIGMVIIIGVSVILSYTLGVLDLFELKWLGVIPILLGVKAFFEKTDTDDILERKNNALIGQVALLTLVNGPDNVVAYIPLYSPLSVKGLFFSISIFLVMTALWCVIGMKLVSHERVGEKLVRFKRYIVPVVLFYVGFSMLLG